MERERRTCYDENPAKFAGWKLPPLESPRELAIVARTVLRVAELFLRARVSDPDFVKLPATPERAREWRRHLHEQARALLDRVRNENLDQDTEEYLNDTARYKAAQAGLYEGIARLLEAIEELENASKEWAPRDDLPDEAMPDTHTPCHRVQYAMMIIAGAMARMYP